MGDLKEIWDNRITTGQFPVLSKKKGNSQESQVFYNCVDRRYLCSYATPYRLEGNCLLSILWKIKEAKPAWEVHTFTLCYNHQGVKDYTVQRLENPGQAWRACRPSTEAVEVGFLEAAALLQDAYRQNVRFKTRLPRGVPVDTLLLDYDTGEVQRGTLLSKLSLRRFTPRMYINLFLAAVKRMDYSLLNDLSTPARQEKLRDRPEPDPDDYLSRCIFLKSGVVRVNREKEQIFADAYAIICTPQDQIVKIDYHFRLLKDNHTWLIDDITETGRWTIPEEHADNPLNNTVVCALFQVDSEERITTWLDGEEEIFLTGELEQARFYKWIVPHCFSWQEYDVNNSILCEFIVIGKEIAVFTQQSRHLPSLEKMMRESGFKATGRVVLSKKDLLGIVARAEINSTAFDMYSLKNILEPYSGRSALLYCRDEKALYSYIYQNSEKVVLDSGCLYALKKRSCKGSQCRSALVEYYICGCWAFINVFNQELEKEIAYLHSCCQVQEKVIDQEWKNAYDLFNPPISTTRRWEIFSFISRFHRQGEALVGLGLVPYAKQVACLTGAVIQGK